MKPSEDSTESDGALQEVEGDQQMVIEIWVEPQLGTIDEKDSPLSYLHGEVYNKIPEKVCLFSWSGSLTSWTIKLWYHVNIKLIQVN